jgi:hypothetical protein
MTAKPSASDFYVIVIGPGMGGMTTAAALPRDDSKVGNRPGAAIRRTNCGFATHLHRLAPGAATFGEILTEGRRPT